MMRSMAYSRYFSTAMAMQTSITEAAQLDRVVGQRPIGPEGLAGSIRDERGGQERTDEDGGAAVQPLELLAPFRPGPPVAGYLQRQPAEHARQRRGGRHVPGDGPGRAHRVQVAAGVDMHVVTGHGGQPGPDGRRYSGQQPSCQHGHRHPVPAARGQPAVGEQPQQDGHQHVDQGPAEEQHRHPAQWQRSVVEPVVQNGVDVGGVRGEQQQGQQQPADRVGRPPGRQQDPHRRAGQRDRQGDQPVDHRATGRGLVQYRRAHQVDEDGAQREQAQHDRQDRRNPPQPGDLAHPEHHLANRPECG